MKRTRSSVQVMLFKDRLEIWNPGHLPFGLTPSKLAKPHNSIPANPLMAEPMYLAGLIERMGTGTGDIILKCKTMGLKTPKFVQEEIFKVILFRKTGKKKQEVTPLITLLIKTELTDFEQDVFSLIVDDPTVSYVEMSEKLQVGRDTVKEYIARLKSKQMIERVGSTRSGYWRIVGK